MPVWLNEMCMQRATLCGRLCFGSVAVMLFLCACENSGGPPTTTTSSRQFKTLAEKIAFLEHYVRFRRTYFALDFNITFHNNGQGRVPGPSDWDIRLIARIPKAQMVLWTKDLHAIASAPTDWLDALPAGISHSGITDWYQNSGRWVGINRVHGVVVYRNTTL